MFEWIADMITYNVFQLAEDSNLAAAVHFFVYDALKILFLIFIVVSIVAFIRTFFQATAIKKFTSKARFGTGNVAASLFGAVTPFCSCSSIPLFLGFIEARIPLGIAFSFLITSPLVNEVAFVMMGEFFGWKLAFLYAFSGIALGVIAGIFIGSLKMENEILIDNNGKKFREKILPKKFSDKIKYAFKEGFKTFKKLYPYVLGGIAVGALIHGFVPEDFFMNYIGQYNALAVPIAIIVGVPIYAGCSTVVPFIFSITASGVPLGTSLAFMMSIAGLSLPEAIILKRIMTMKLLVIFFGIVALGILFIGYLFNFLELI